MIRLSRFLCGLHGHPDAMLVHAPDRIYLSCGCGYESPGVTVARRNEPPAPVIKRRRRQSSGLRVVGRR